MSEGQVSAVSGGVTHIVGERRLLIAQTSAALRNADESASLRATIWYPAAPGSETMSIDIGPADAPHMLVGRVAPQASFATEERHPVILYSHGSRGCVRTTAWFGTALARAGYVVIAVDHPGDNMEDAVTPAGGLLWWLRADDLGAALDQVASDPMFRDHIDPARVGVSGFSLGGLTAMIALGGVFDGRLFDDYCAGRPDAAVCPPAELSPIFDPDKAGYPEVLKAELLKMTTDRRIPAVRAGFVMAPLAIGFRPESLGAITAPVTFIVGSHDAIVGPEVGAALAASMIAHAELVVVAGANHDSFINLCSPAGRAAGYCQCAVATAQELTHAISIQSALAVFDPVLKRV